MRYLSNGMDCRDHAADTRDIEGAQKVRIL
jgi:hypothetical protein